MRLRRHCLSVGAFCAVPSLVCLWGLREFILQPFIPGLLLVETPQVTDRRPCFNRTGLSPEWLEVHGNTSEEEVPQPVAWILCTGTFRPDDVAAFHRLRRADDIVVSLNKFLHSRIFLDLNMRPTHHWLVEAGPVADGRCARWYRRKHKIPTEKTMSECRVAASVIRNAKELGVSLVAKAPVLDYARELFGNASDHMLLDVKTFERVHPVPVALNALTLGHGVRIALGLTPRGAAIKLFGCDGEKTGSSRPHANLKAVTKKFGDTAKMLTKTCPRWDLQVCNNRSRYVTEGVMPHADCFP